MGALIVVKTKTEEPDVQLYQGTGGLDELTQILRTEPDVWDLKTRVYALRPDSNSSRCIRGAIRLQQVYSQVQSSAAEVHLQEALYYARVDGSKTESEVLRGFLGVVHHHFKEAQDREERHQGPPTGVSMYDQTDPQLSKEVPCESSTLTQTLESGITPTGLTTESTTSVLTGVGPAYAISSMSTTTEENEQ